MKKMSSKFLSVLLTLGLLVALIVPAGMLPTSAATTPADDPIVTVIDFTDTSLKANGDPKTTYGFGVFRNGQNYQSNETPYIVTFEYYLPKATNVAVSYTGGWLNNTSKGGADAYALQQGHHVYYETFTLAKPESVPFIAPTLYCEAKDTVLYVWNFSVTVAGKKLSPNGSENMANNVASSADKTLSSYDWVKTMDIVDNTEVTTIDFTAGSNKEYAFAGVFRSKSISDDNPFIVSFEYYMPTISSISISGSGNSKTLANYSYALQPGYHKYEAAFSTSASVGSDAIFSPRVSNPKKDCKLYVWNFSVVAADGSSVSNNPNEAMGNNVPSGKTTGLTNFDWYDPDMYTSPSVSKITFTDKETFGLGSYTGTSNASTLYEVSFEYYLPEDMSGLSFSIPNGATTVSNSGIVKTAGYHKFVWTGYYASGQSRIVPAIYGTAGKTVYIWNYSVKLNGIVRPINADYGDWRYVADRPDTMKCLSNYEWSKTMDLPTVTKIDFAGGDRWSKYMYRKTTQSAENPYHVTFEYYMPQEMEAYYSNPGGYCSVADGSVIMKQGRHTFDAKLYITPDAPSDRTNRLIPAINSKKAGTLYIWNFKVTLDGVDITNDKSGDYAATAAVDSSKKLHEYPAIYDVDTATFADQSANDTVFVIKGEDMTKEYLGSDASNEMSIFYHGSIGVNKSNYEWVFSFEYYLPEEAAYYVRRANGYNAMADDTTGSSRLQPGRHTFTCTFNAKTMYQLNGDCVPGIAFSYDPNHNYTYPNLYIWNWQLTRNAEGQVPLTTMTHSSGFAGLVMDKNTGEYPYLDTITFGELSEMMDEDVDMATELDFSYADRDGGLVAHKSSAFTVYTTQDYVLSFDYYLPNKGSKASVYLPSTYYKVNGSSTLTNDLTGNVLLEPGFGKFESTITGMNTEQTIVRFYVNFCMGADGDLSKLYVWNLKMLPADETVSKDELLMSGKWIEADGVTAKANAIKVSDLKALDEETVDYAEELNMVGAQTREDNALRFINAVEMSGAVRNEDGTADYSAATVMVDGVARQVVTAGTVFAREMKISGVWEDVLRIGNENVFYIRAEKLQAEVYHERYLGEGVEGVVFTGVIKNIPETALGERLIARSYVIYKDANGANQVLYGDVISRSFDFVNAAVGA